VSRVALEAPPERAKVACPRPIVAVDLDLCRGSGGVAGHSRGAL